MSTALQVTFGIIGTYALGATCFYIYVLYSRPQDVHKFYWERLDSSGEWKKIIWINFNLVMAVSGLVIMLYCGASGVFGFLPKNWGGVTEEGDFVTVTESMAGLVATLGLIALCTLYDKCADALNGVEYLKKQKNKLEEAVVLIKRFSSSESDFDRYMSEYVGDDGVTVDWRKIGSSEYPDVAALIVKTMCGYDRKYKL